MLDHFIGQTLADKYRIDSVMRDGGAFGRVYRATHLLMDKSVTVKILAPALAVDENIVKRFSHEARAVSRIAHPNILNVTDFGADKTGATYIVFESADGATLLRDEIIREGALPFERAASIARQIAAALVAAHAGGTIHRGLTSENVLLMRAPDGAELVKVLDFGAFAEGENDSANGASSTRNLEYLSPEQNASVAEADERSDIYSLGVIFYEMLAGEVPYAADNATDLLLKQAHNPPAPLSAFRDDLSAAIEPLILRALAKNPDLRYQTAAEFAADLTPPRALPMKRKRLSFRRRRIQKTSEIICGKRRSSFWQEFRFWQSV
jgi:serine/threonine-protein kinase